ncbi:hypothetical protein DQ04_13711010, partial [Trypanosoma grayi]|uniref:hypothetical protein n=1 Tax=Trypanosoma grayi TaxID=71804 RepID=UPI0004F40868
MMPVILRHVLSVMVITLCCACVCVAADATWTPQRLLNTVKDSANRAKRETEEVKRTSMSAESWAAQARKGVSNAHSTVVLLGTAVNSAPKKENVDHVKRLASSAVGLVRSADYTLSTASFHSSFAVSAVKRTQTCVESLQSAWRKLTVKVGLEESELVKQASKKVEDAVLLLAVAENRSVEALLAIRSVAEYTGKASPSVTTAQQRAQNLKVTQEPKILDEELRKAANEAEQTLKQASDAAEIAVIKASDASTEEYSASKVAAFMDEFLAKALSAVEEKVKTYPTPPEDRSPPQPPPGETKQESHGNNPQEKQHTDALTPSQLSGQQPSSTSVGTESLPDTSKKELNENSAMTVSSTSRSGTGTTDISTGSAQNRYATDSSEEADVSGTNTPDINRPAVDITAPDTNQSPSVPSEEKTAAESLENAASQAADAPLTPPKSNANNVLRDILTGDSSVSPSWVRTPLLLVVIGVLG